MVDITAISILFMEKMELEPITLLGDLLFYFNIDSNCIKVEKTVLVQSSNLTKEGINRGLERLISEDVLRGENAQDCDELNFSINPQYLSDSVQNREGIEEEVDIWERGC